MLPSGYLQVEYIAGTGTQYINSLFVPNQNTRVYAECVFPTASSTQALFGSRTSSSANQFQYVTSGNYYRSDYNTAASNVTNASYGTAKYYVDKAKNVFDLNGDHSLTQTYAAFTCPGPMYIFATNNNGSVYALASATIYVFRVYDNDVLVRDMIPAKRLSDGAVGMYDVVNDVFYSNAGTGSFVAGPYLADEKDVVLLEYIESSGTQHINTRLSMPSGFEAKMRVSLAASSSAQALIGAIDNASPYNRNYFAALANLSRWNVGAYDDIACGSAIEAGVDYDIEFSTVHGNVYCKVNGIAQSISTPSNSARSAKDVYIFDFNYAVPTPASAKMCYCQILDGSGAVKRDYYPARFAPTSEAGLYDTANGTFYINAGTGTFIEGPEIPTKLLAPQNLRAASVTESAITIEWDAVEKATGYKVFRNYVPVSEGTATTYTDYAPEPYNGYIYSVAAYNENMQSVQAEIRVASVGGHPILDLITDRTSEDVEYAKRLAAKGLAAMTEEERTAFLGGLKGAYNATDLNRVESAVAFLPAFLNGIQNEINRYLASLGVAEDELYRVPYDTPIAELETKTDWAIVDVPREADFARYLANIAAARNWIDLPSGAPAAPESIQKLTADAANAIEQILFGVFETAIAVKEDKLIYADLAKDAWKYCGTFNCGQEVIF